MPCSCVKRNVIMSLLMTFHMSIMLPLLLHKSCCVRLVMLHHHLVLVKSSEESFFLWLKALKSPCYPVAFNSQILDILPSPFVQREFSLNEGRSPGIFNVKRNLHTHNVLKLREGIYGFTDIIPYWFPRFPDIL